MKEKEAEEKFEALVKEKDELLELSMQRGKIIQASHIAYETLNDYINMRTK